MSQPDKDLLQRFLFEHSDVRGEIVSLHDSYQAIIANNPVSGQNMPLLGEFSAAAALLSATLKFDGIITLQAKPKDASGPIQLIMADCTRHHNLRATIRFKDEKTLNSSKASNFRTLFDGGYLSITIDPVKGERYQGIVAIEHDSLSACLSDYFQQSEQLPTQIWLAADNHRAAGLLLQALPTQLQSSEERSELWQHLLQMGNTITADEQLQLSHEEQLHRLFHQETVQLFPPASLQFSCSCSRARTANMLITLGEDEIKAIIEEKNTVDVTCEFCHYIYRFNAKQAATLFKIDSPTLH